MPFRVTVRWFLSAYSPALPNVSDIGRLEADAIHAN
jgi:hypothetical protein